MYRWHPKLAEVDPDNPSAWATCSRCGFVTNLYKMVWQWDYRGTPAPINTRVLTCGRPQCLDVPQPQNSPLILGPDPEPIFNARPASYFLDEASWLITEDGEVITTEDGEGLGTAIPNPSNNAATAYLNALIVSSGGSVATAYLDVFNGNPEGGGGTSVLEDITGSATRTNIAADLTTTLGIAQNTDTIIVALESGATVNTNYLGIYSAATAGTLLMSGPCWVNGQVVTIGNPVVFSPLALNINLN